MTTTIKQAKARSTRRASMKLDFDGLGETSEGSVMRLEDKGIRQTVCDKNMHGLYHETEHP